jgi:hypothetical protein
MTRLSASCQARTYIPELHEIIITLLPRVDILTRAQLVSHTLNTAVASPLVQEKLRRLRGKTLAEIANEWECSHEEAGGIPGGGCLVPLHFLRIEHRPILVAQRNAPASTANTRTFFDVLLLLFLDVDQAVSQCHSVTSEDTMSDNPPPTTRKM